MPGDSYAKRKERDRARKKKAADQRSADQAADFRAAQREALRTHRANLDEPDVEAARAEARQQMARLREARGDDERFRAQHVRLVRASDADLNVELVDFPHCSEELKQASHDFFRTIFLPRVPCECCGEVKRGNNMKKAASIEQLRQHHIPDARPPADVCLCHRCHSFKPAATQPSCPYSRVNFPAPQPTPPELQDLTLAEKEVIRLVHPFQALLILPKGQQGARGQVIHLPEQPADKIATLLPADPGDVLLVAREKPGGKLGMYHRLRVDVVLRALQYLKQHNHLYRDVIIRAPDDVKTLFDNWERSVATAPVLPDPDRPPEATLQPTPSPAGPSNVPSAGRGAEEPVQQDRQVVSARSQRAGLRQQRRDLTGSQTPTPPVTSSSTAPAAPAPPWDEPFLRTLAARPGLARPPDAAPRDATAHVEDAHDHATAPTPSPSARTPNASPPRGVLLQGVPAPIPPPAPQPSTPPAGAVADDEQPAGPPTSTALLDMDGSQAPARKVLPPNAAAPVDRKSESVEAAAYPWLYPTGRGDFTDPSRSGGGDIKYREFVRHKAQLAATECQQDESWMFRALNGLNQQEVAGAVSWVVQKLRSTPDRHDMDVITAGRLLASLEGEGALHMDPEDVLGSYYASVGGAVRGTAQYWGKAKRHLFAMYGSLGSPDLFLTLSANDLNWLDVFHAIDARRFRSEADVASLSAAERVALLNKAPAIVAQHFTHRVDALIDFLKSPAKPLGYRLRDIFFRFEIQGRGSPHVHSVLWLDGCPKPTDPTYLAWLDTIIVTRVPDPAADPALHHLVSKCQFHAHTQTCQGHDSLRRHWLDVDEALRAAAAAAAAAAEAAAVAAAGAGAGGAAEREAAPGPAAANNGAENGGQSAETRRAYAEQDERSRCRFHFPHPLAEQTHFRTDAERRYAVDGDRNVVFQRLTQQDRMTNNYNPHILRIWQANMDLQPVSDPYAAAVYMLSYVVKNEKSEKAHLVDALGKLAPDTPVPQVLRRIGNAVLSFREVSKQECALLLLGIPMYMSSATSVFVPCFPPGQRTRMTLPASVLATQDPESRNIWQKNLLDHYRGRPSAPPHNAFWDALTLGEFAAWFELEGASSPAADPDAVVPLEHQEYHLDPREDDEPARAPAASKSRPAEYEPNLAFRTSPTEPPFRRRPGAKDVSRALPRFLLASNRTVRMRRKPRCVTCPVNSHDNLTTKYAVLAMSLPFRDELRDLVGVENEGDLTEERVEAVLRERQAEIEAVSSRREARFAERVAELMLKLQNGGDGEDELEREGDDLGDEADDHADFHDAELLQAMEVDPAAAAAAPPVVTTFLADNTDELQENVARLSQEQRAVYDIVSNYLSGLDRYDAELTAWRRTCEAAQVVAGHPVPEPPSKPAPPRLVVVGPGGTGKSFLIRTLVLRVRKWAQLRMAARASQLQGVLLAAPTGIAAFNIAGTTLHHILRLKVEKRGAVGDDRLGREQARVFRSLLKNCVVAMVDELSMMASRVLRALHTRLNFAMNTPAGYFGDVAVVLFGDPLQLPPVCATAIYQNCKELSVSNTFHLYRSLFTPFVLRMPQRQRGHDDFARLLLRARVGALTPDDVGRLATRTLRCNPALQTNLKNEFKDAIWLLPRKQAAMQRNEIRVREVANDTGQQLYLMRAQDEVRGGAPDLQGLDPDLTGGLHTSLLLCNGAVVMLRRNIDVARGLFNGARGRIAEILTPAAAQPQGDEGPARRSARQRPVVDSAPLPVYIVFDHQGVDPGGRLTKEFEGLGRGILIEPLTATFDVQQRQVKRTQLPLMPAFAVTIHKAQGLTLPKAVVDCSSGRGGIFAGGQAYTALSRVRCLEDLILLDFDPGAVFARPDAIKEVARLEALAAAR